MANDRELLRQIIERDLDNTINAELVPLIGSAIPISRVILPNYVPILKAVVMDRYVDPVINGLIPEARVTDADIDMAGAYVQEEFTSKIQDFKKRYKTELVINNDENL